MLSSFYKNIASVFFIIIAMIVCGIISFKSLPVALYPQTVKPKIEVNLQNFKVSREHFKDIYGQFFESKILALKGVQELQGWYEESSARWTIEFDWGIKEEDAKIQIESIANGMYLPNDWAPFRVDFARHSGDIYLSITSPSHTEEQLYELIFEKVKYAIDKIPGAGFVFLSKPKEDKIKITLLQEHLISLNLKSSEVLQAIKDHKYDLALGTMESKTGDAVSIASLKAVYSLDDLKEMIVAKRGEKMIRLVDVAEVNIESEVPKYFVRGNGKRGLIAGARPNPNVNIAEFCDLFEQTVREKIAQIDPSIQIDVLINPSTFIKDAINNVSESVATGMLIAIFIIFLFLASFWQTFVVAITIPISLLGGFILMKAIHLEVNLISLGAMALAVGMVVDGSIVVIENIVRHLKERQPASYFETLDVILKSVIEVRSAVIASLLTTVIVFAPLVFTAPLAYAVLGDLAKVVVCVLIIASFVSIMIVPALMLFRPKASDSKTGIKKISYIFQFFIEYLEKKYILLLSFLMNKPHHKKAVFLFLCLLFVAGGYLVIKNVKREIVAEPDSDKIWLVADFMDESDAEKSEEKFIPIEKTIQKEFGDKITHFYSNIWTKGGAILCNLKNKNDLPAFRKALEDRFTNTPDTKFFVEPWTPSALRLPHPSLVGLSIEGMPYEQKIEALQKIVEVVQRVDGVGRAKDYPYAQMKQSFKLTFDDELLYRLETGLSIKSQIEETIKLALTDEFIKSLPTKQIPLPLYAGFPKKMISSEAALEHFLIREGENIFPVRHFARIDHSQRFATLFTDAGKEVAKMEVKEKASFEGSKTKLKEEVLAAIEKSLVPRENMVFFDPSEEINQNILSLVYALFIALVLIWIVISLQFGSIKQVGIIMLAIPLGMIGISFSLYLFNSSICVNSMLGMILLCGTAVNNSIIFIDFYNQLKATQKDLHLSEIILKTASLRLRPILITTLTTILGMIPIAFGFGHGGEILQPLGIAVCGGLGVSTFLTLFVIPLILHDIESSSSLRKDFSLKHAFVFFAIFSLAFFDTKKSMAFDWQMAEDLYVKHHPSLPASQSKLMISQLQSEQMIYQWVPSLSFSHHQSIPLEEKSTSIGSNSFNMSLNMPNPFVYLLETSQKDLALKQNHLLLDMKKKQLSHEGRMLYFKAKASFHKYQNTKLAFDMGKQIEAGFKKRYERGFISKNAYDRISFQIYQYSAEWQNAKNAYNQNLWFLKQQLGLTEIKDESFASSIDEKFLALSDVPIKKLLPADYVSMQTRSLEIEAIKQKKTAEQISYRYLPNLSAIVQKYEPFKSSSSLSGSLSFNWTIYDQSSKTYETRIQAESMQITTSLLVEQRQADHIQIRTLSEELRRLIMVYEDQKKLTQLSKNLADSSEISFEKGFLNIKDMLDDLRSYINQKNFLIDSSLAIIEHLSLISKETGEKDFLKQIL